MSIHIQHVLHKVGGCAIFSRAMQGSSKISESQRTEPAIKIDGAEIHLIRLPLLEPFETSFGAIDSRLIFLICLQADGLRGWGEVVAAEEPRYSYETVRTAFHVIKDFFGPALLSEPITGLDDLAQRLAPFRGHNMAKAGLELAFMEHLAAETAHETEPLTIADYQQIAGQAFVVQLGDWIFKVAPYAESAADEQRRQRVAAAEAERTAGRGSSTTRRSRRSATSGSSSPALAAAATPRSWRSSTISIR